MYGNLFSFYPKFKMIFATNNEPNLGETNDYGTSRRLVYIKFSNKFCDNPTKTNERKINLGLSNLLAKNNYKLAFMHMLIKNYHYLEDNGYVSSDDHDGKNLEVPKDLLKPKKSY